MLSEYIILLDYLILFMMGVFEIKWKVGYGSLPSKDDFLRETMIER